MASPRVTLRDVYSRCQELDYTGASDSPHHLFHRVVSRRSLVSLLHRIIINHDHKQLCDYGLIEVYFDCPVLFNLL